MTQYKIEPEKETIERYCLVCESETPHLLHAGGRGYYFCAFCIDDSDMSDSSDSGVFSQ